MELIAFAIFRPFCGQEQPVERIFRLAALIFRGINLGG